MKYIITGVLLIALYQYDTRTRKVPPVQCVLCGMTFPAPRSLVIMECEVTFNWYVYEQCQIKINYPKCCVWEVCLRTGLYVTKGSGLRATGW